MSSARRFRDLFFVRAITLNLADEGYCGMAFSWRRSGPDRFEAFISPRLKTMYRVAYRFCGSVVDAEDLVQDVVIKLMSRIDELEALDNPDAWLGRVIYRQFVDQRRYQQRQRTVSFSVVGPGDDPLGFMEDSFVAEDTSSPDHRFQQSQLHISVAQVLGCFTAEQRALLVLADMESMPLHDVAEIMGIPVGTVKSRLHRTRGLLRDRLQNWMEPNAGLRRVNE